MLFFFFNDTATTEIYTLSLHDALPICDGAEAPEDGRQVRLGGAPDEHLLAHPVAHEVGDGDDFQIVPGGELFELRQAGQDRKSTRLNSSHANISYAVFCLKKKTSTTSA